ncbi:TonB-dependent receptor [Tenacibaculum piscium]|uniref:TonB-dependent receptor n=1 Tax=Tenacibaculum piscium TaxID=1458515 RepID=A0A2H1YKP0_9FLAO|nr:TonB-dependent receptor [Tenacibaculum piscium]MBE7629218.1 TonB-dependent receptor [Tenacibaculum piscium]MBE7670005.1 TonB-dependent receptor [Tenacibaculum piscium]MBE7685570.1 TonB-dependent receptor [Tenacibaculum piscium]SOS75991.1 TonB-dependent receptor [Tenacibaculum piscium]
MKPIIVLFFLFTSLVLFSQKLTLIDAKTGKAIDGVAVYNKNKTKSAISSVAGFVNISEFKKEEILIFSHVSYADFQEKKAVLKKNNYQVYLSKHTEQLDEIIVSVFKNKEKTNRIAEQIAVVSLQDIQKISPQTSADLLANIAGIKVQKSQFGGGSPVLRGMESNRVLLVVDGVRMNNAIYRKGHLQNSITVNPNLLERTEVVFGPSSVIYGSDALGGVIHYYTKTPKLFKVSNQNKNENKSKNKSKNSSKKSTIKASHFLRYSSVNNEVTNSITAELQFEKWASLTNISHSNFEDLKMGKNRTHGFDNWGKVFFYSDNLNGNYTENPKKNTNVNLQKNTGFHQTDFLQKFFVPLSKNTDFKLNIQYSTSSDIPRFDKLTALKDGGLKFAEWYYAPQNRVLISSQLDINPKKKWLEKGTIILAYQNIEESRIQRKFGSLKRSYKHENVNVFSINTDFTVPLAKKRDLAYGFELTYNDVNSKAYGKILKINNTNNSEIRNNSIGFEDDFIVQSRYPDGGSNYFSSAMYLDYRQDISRNSTLNTGIRCTNTQLNAHWKNQKFIKLPSNDIHLENTAVTATAGYVYKPAENWQLNTVFSSGFRSPNIDDVGKVREKNGEVTVPNIYLKPEHAYNAELGAQKYFNHKKFRIGANIYYTLLNNYIYREAFILGEKDTILYQEELTNIVANVNKGNAYITGGTLSYQGQISENWKTLGTITYTKGRAYDTNLPLSSIPPLFGRFELNYFNEKFETGANFIFNAKKDISKYNLEEGIDNQQQTPVVNQDITKDIDSYYGSPSWVTLGLYAKYIVNSNVTIQTQCSNLLDAHYKEFASGISASGRNISVSLVTNF